MKYQLQGQTNTKNHLFDQGATGKKRPHKRRGIGAEGEVAQTISCQKISSSCLCQQGPLSQGKALATRERPKLPTSMQDPLS